MRRSCTAEGRHREACRRRTEPPEAAVPASIPPARPPPPHRPPPPPYPPLAQRLSTIRAAEASPENENH